MEARPSRAFWIIRPIDNQAIWIIVAKYSILQGLIVKNALWYKNLLIFMKIWNLNLLTDLFKLFLSFAKKNQTLTNLMVQTGLRYDIF